MSTDVEEETPLRCLSSMATRSLLAELVAAYPGSPFNLVSLGGVEAARRIRAGEAVDVVVLASGPMAALEAEGHLVPGSTQAIVRSAVAAAVPAGAARPDITSAAALRQALTSAGRIAYSTGPSGEHLLALMKRWSIEAKNERRLVRAEPSVPVASLLAQGEADLGFQQLSELAGQPGITLLEPLPAEAQHLTTFLAGIGTTSQAGPAARRLIDFLATAETGAVKRRHGMEPS